MAASMVQDHTITTADTSDVPSLSTVVSRSFHPVNPFIKECFPDTTRMREWWTSVFASEIEDPRCQLLVSRSRHNDRDTEQVAGIVSIRRMGALERGAGLWSMFPFIEDHGLANLLPVSSAMIEYRERLMLGREHYLLEIFGVSQNAKGLGLGRRLLEAVSQIADAEGLDVFVQSNAVTEPLYCKFGFVRNCEVCVKGKMNYIEYMLVRKSQRF